MRIQVHTNICFRSVQMVMDRTLNCLTPGGVCDRLCALLKGVQRDHDTPRFYGSWLPGFFFLAPVSSADEWDLS
jgi:hypothetical protein